MENYYILLELPFDPPENDEKKIEAAIEKKRKQWSSESTRTSTQAKAKAHLELVDDITRVMLDPKLRKAQAEEARKLKKAALKDLEAKLKKGIGIEKPERLKRYLDKTVSEFAPYGYSEQFIRDMFEKLRKDSDKTQAIDLSMVIDKSIAASIQKYMKALDMDEGSLYDFLELPPNSSCEQLCDKADAMNKREQQKGEKTARGTTISQLCGLCKTVFKSEAEQKKYDNYVSLTRFSKVNDDIDEMARLNDRKITPTVKETLIDTAVRQYGVSVSDASTYIENYCTYKGYALPDNKIICGLCGQENPAGSINCSKCGKPLIIHCPSCGADNNNAAKMCAKCKFDLTRMDEAADLIKQAREKLAEKNLDEADTLLKKSEALWPNHPDIVALKQTIVSERDKASRAIASIMDDIQSRRLYSARTHIEQAKNAGYKIDDSLSATVSQSLREVEEKLSAMRAASGDEAFTIAMSLTEMVTDSEELTRSLAQYPPDACEDLTCRRSGSEVTISWSRSLSVGNLTYHLVRRENAFPNSPSDGELIYTGTELSYTDSKLRNNVIWYYCVFTERIGVFSSAAHLSDPVVIVGGVSKLRATGADGMVTLSWTKNASVSKIMVWKYCGEERPETETAYESVPCARLDGLNVNELNNGDMYWFAVSAGYTLNGKTFYSDKAYISAVPQRPARPLQNFKVSYQEDLFRASWDQSEWDVILFSSMKKPDYAVDLIYDLDDLLSAYKKVEMNLKSMTEADFKMGFVGECWIIPGVINASNVILNTAVCVTSVPPVRDISFDLNNTASEMYVNFTWPKRTEHALLVYRMDAYPKGPEDTLAVRMECSKRQYEMNDGIVISNPAQGTFHAIVYIYAETDEKRVYSEGVQALLSNEPQRDVLYSLKYKKGSLFNKTCRLTIEVEVSGKCVFPAFVIVAKYKGTPLKRGDGSIVCTVSDNTEITKSHTFDFEVDSLRPDTRLKMFFMNDKYYKAFKIACKSGNTI